MSTQTLGKESVVERSMRSILVGNISSEVSEEKLKELFSEFGPVINLKCFKDSSSGYAFCEYGEQEVALRAIRNLSNYELKGKVLKVDIASSEKSKEELESLYASIIASPFEVADGTSEKAPEEISKAVASLPAEQMFELMKQMKMCIENNPQEARNLLLQNPQLAFALLQAQVIMRIVDPEVALKILNRPDPMLTAEQEAKSVAEPLQQTGTVASNLSEASSMGDQDLRQLPPMDCDMRTSVLGTGDKDMRLPTGDSDLRTMASSGGVMDKPPFDPRFRAGDPRAVQVDPRGARQMQGSDPRVAPSINPRAMPSDPRMTPSADLRGMPTTDPRSMPGPDPRGMSGLDPRGMPGSDSRGMPGSDPRGMPGVDPRGIPGTDSRGMPGTDPRGMPGADPRGMSGGDQRGMSGGDQRGMSGTDPRGMSGADPRGMSGADPRMMSTDPRMGPGTDPRMGPGTDPRMGPGTDPRMGLGTDPRMMQGTDPRVMSGSDPRVMPGADPRGMNRADPRMMQGLDPRMIQGSDPRVQSSDPRSLPNVDPRAMSGSDPRTMSGMEMGGRMPSGPNFGSHPTANVDPRVSFDGRNVPVPSRVEDPRTASAAARGPANIRAPTVNAPSQNAAGMPPNSAPGPRQPPPTTSGSSIPEDEEKAALIMQVLQLSEEQIAMLPPEQRQSIIVLKEQIARSQLAL